MGADEGRSAHGTDSIGVRQPRKTEAGSGSTAGDTEPHAGMQAPNPGLAGERSVAATKAEANDHGVIATGARRR